MDNIGVIIYGMGGVGCSLLRSINTSRNIVVTGAVDVLQSKVGKDAGCLAGIEAIGVSVTDSLEKACESSHADVVINAASSAEAEDTFKQMLPAIQCSKNVLVANSATFDLWNGEIALANRIDEECKKYGVSYAGIGNTQAIERTIMLMTEGTESIESLRFTHWADVSEFSAISNANQLGISLDKHEYEIGLVSGQYPALVKWREDLVRSIAYHAGLNISKIDYDRELKCDQNGKIFANISHLKGYEDNVARIYMDWIFVLDPEHKYYDKIEIKGTPSTDCTIMFTPDRGKIATSSVLMKAIPYIVSAKPGYISTFDMPILMNKSNETH